MTETIEQTYPAAYAAIDQATKASGFTMASEVLTCGLLRTLAAAKPGGRFLELGTGTGLSTAWILDGMDAAATLISVDHAPEFLTIAQQHLGDDARLRLVCSDGGDWIERNKRLTFDYIFADTWHGKYFLLEETLAMLNPGGFYLIDDMMPQPNWPEGHHAKALTLLDALEEREDLYLTRQCWATGLVIAVKKSVNL